VTRFLRFPLVWMLIGAVGVSLVAGLTATSPVLAVPGAAVALGIYAVVMRRVAHRDTPELAHGVRRTLGGVALGLGFFAVSMAMVVTEFTISDASAGAGSVWLHAVTITAGAAVTEELIFRGLLLQALERLLGSWAALAITAVLFGVLHLANPGASAWSAVAIAIEAGVLLGAAYLWLRSLWFVIGLHFAWNLAQWLMGVPVSGHADPGLLVARPDGPDLLTGGSFGLEASLAPVLVSLVLSALMLVGAHRRGHLVKP
jgi:uncharacterized protein